MRFGSFIDSAEKIIVVILMKSHHNIRACIARLRVRARVANECKSQAGEDAQLFLTALYLKRERLKMKIEV